MSSQVIIKPESRTPNGSLAFVHRLPEEILALVFHACFPHSLPKSTGLNLLSAIFTSAPCNISQVCSRWRAIALSHSSLWARWHVDIRDISSKDVWKLVDVLSLWRDRSKNEPLTAFIAVRGRVTRAEGDGRKRMEDDDDVKNAITALLELLYALEARWRRVKLAVYASNASIGVPIRRLDPAKLGRLQELHLFDKPRFEVVPPPRSVNDSTSSATVPTFGALRTLVLRGARNSKRCPVIVRQCMTILHHAPCLDTLEIRIRAPEVDNITGAFPVATMPTLRYLLVKVDEQPAENFMCKFVLDHLVAPALETLYVISIHRSDMIEGAFDASGFVNDFISRSRPPLKELALYMPMTGPNLMNTLDQLPTLQELYLDDLVESGWHFPSALLKAGVEEEALCPRLRRLIFFVTAEVVPFALRVLIARWPSPFTKRFTRAAYAMWLEKFKGTKNRLSNEEMKILDDWWITSFAHWAEGPWHACRLRFGKSKLSAPDAKPSSETGLF
ncbi:hypothetical protein SCHPADRAFT_367795 [Schizopora paradoxa]|uniref:Uncharacterized protein n=1 Tax=Schizopora paradoxa TaxID=27342 RepID=A0A0H2RNI1_9AGAM|nr:hypothetical protein SCHPADRAFT_367795 [Schizopora paradoxa]